MSRRASRVQFARADAEESARLPRGDANPLPPRRFVARGVGTTDAITPAV